MVEYKETIGEDTQKRVLRNMLENIAQELDSHYDGTLIVEKGYAYTWGVDPSQTAPSFYIAEQICEPKRFLMFFSRRTITKKPIFLIHQTFLNNIYSHLFDKNAESTILRYLDQHVQKYGITKIHMIREE